MSMLGLAKILFIVGVAILILSGLFYLAGRMGISPGRLPGDLRFESKNMTCVVGLGTSIVLSIILTLLINIILKLSK